MIEHSIGPVWEANHVWLIFVIVLCWTGFPGVFAAVSSTMYISLTLVALGIIARGAAFAFRKASTELGHRRLYGAAFALSSVLTPFFLGTVAGGVASGRVPAGIASGDVVTSWLNPTSLLAAAVAALLWGWAAAQYPVLLYPDTTVQAAAAHPAVLRVSLITVGVGSVLLLPSLIWMFALFQRGTRLPERDRV